MWQAGIEGANPLNAEVPLSFSKRTRRSLHDLEMFFVKNALPYCINHPDCWTMLYPGPEIGLRSTLKKPSRRVRAGGRVKPLYASVRS